MKTARPLARKIFRILSLSAAAAAVVYGLVAAELYFNQSAHLYHPRESWSGTPESMGRDYEEAIFSAADGTRLSGWYVRRAGEGARRGVVLFCHGNAGNISDESIPIRLFTELGFDIFLFDYRGFGKSAGRPDEPGTAMDADAAWGYLVNEKKVRPEEIVVCGRSFGAAVAIPLVVRHASPGDAPRALLVEAAFSSLASVASEMHPYFPVRLLLRSRYDSLSRISAVPCPVLVVHSRDDKLIPFSHGRRLFDAAPEPKEFLEITGPHNNKNDPVSQAAYRRGVSAFLDRVFPKP